MFRGAAETEEKLKAAVEAGRGKDCDGEFTAELMGWMCERCGQVSIGNEWICADPYVQQDHAADPFDAFTRPVTNQSIYYFTQMMSCIVGDQWAEQVPKELPFYNIGGDQDPVGEYGKGIYEVSNWLCETGHQVKTKVYSATATRFTIIRRSRTRWRRGFSRSWTGSPSDEGARRLCEAILLI